MDDVLKAIKAGKIIEKYRDDRPFPSFLLYGRSDDKPIHIVCALPKHVDIYLIQKDGSISRRG